MSIDVRVDTIDLAHIDGYTCASTFCCSNQARGGEAIFVRIDMKLWMVLNSVLSEILKLSLR